jgi:hypothetical protein
MKIYLERWKCFVVPAGGRLSENTEFERRISTSFVKKSVCIEKPPVTSSNCYETMKKASILFKLGSFVESTIDSETAYTILNFPLPWQRWDI